VTRQLKNPGLISGRGEKDFSLLHSIQTDSMAHQPHIQWELRGVSLGVKWPGHGADLLPPSSAEVKNGGAILHFPYTSSWCGA
jgi:hypothetical protein